MEKVIIGVDIGGTSIKIGIIDESGDILKKWQIPTDLQDAGSNIVHDIWLSILKNIRSQRIEKHMIIGIGVGAPGFIDGRTGVVDEAVNLGWKNYALKDRLNELSGLPVFVDNDANTAVLGENWKGAGEQAKNVIAITLGTGVGGGIIANGTVLNGENGTAGEIGHITVDPNGKQCNCGRKGCLETIASATGIAHQAMAIIEKDPESLLAKRYKQKKTITAKDVFDLAFSGDEVSMRIIDYTCDVLGFAIANLAAVVNPSKILIGGGVSKAGDALLDGIRSSFDKYALGRLSDVCELKIAQLGNDAGIIGAAFLVKQQLHHMTF
ncbi:MAG TPA: ROK family glucokinase [Bacillota bacterium]|nr:ROK family glucokinase [Bacillota bacterium]